MESDLLGDPNNPIENKLIKSISLFNILKDTKTKSSEQDFHIKTGIY